MKVHRLQLFADDAIPHLYTAFRNLSRVLTAVR